MPLHSAEHLFRLTDISRIACIKKRYSIRGRKEDGGQVTIGTLVLGFESYHFEDSTADVISPLVGKRREKGFFLAVRE